MARVGAAMAVCSLVAFVAACGSDGGETRADDSDDDVYSLSISTADLAFSAEIPDDHIVRDQFDADDSCRTITYTLTDGLRFQAVAADCEFDNTDIGNGYLGYYRTIDDVAAPVDPQSIDTALGPATLVGQEYYECTNECNEWELDLAIIELSDPVNATFPTLVVRFDDSDHDRDDLVAIVHGLSSRR